MDNGVGAIFGRGKCTNGQIMRRASAGPTLDVATDANRVDVSIFTSRTGKHFGGWGANQFHIGGSNVANGAGVLVCAPVVKRKAGRGGKFLVTLGASDCVAGPAIIN